MFIQRSLLGYATPNFTAAIAFHRLSLYTYFKTDQSVQGRNMIHSKVKGRFPLEQR